MPPNTNSRNGIAPASGPPTMRRPRIIAMAFHLRNCQIFVPGMINEKIKAITRKPKNMIPVLLSDGKGYVSDGKPLVEFEV